MWKVQYGKGSAPSNIAEGSLLFCIGLTFTLSLESLFTVIQLITKQECCIKRQSKPVMFTVHVQSTAMQTCGLLRHSLIAGPRFRNQIKDMEELHASARRGGVGQSWSVSGRQCNHMDIRTKIAQVGLQLHHVDIRPTSIGVRTYLRGTALAQIGLSGPTYRQ